MKTLTQSDVVRSEHRSHPISLIEQWGAKFVIGVILVLRMLYAWNYRIDSDEPQHLHVVWAWANGLLPYRDVFDNHAPLFQALCAPLFHWLGARPDILVPMRLAMIPLFAACVWCAWKITATFFSPRTALWTALLAALCPPWFLNSVEFRPDQLWALAWLASLTILATGKVTPLRAFATGLMLGAAFSVSMKSCLLLFSLTLALAGALILWRCSSAPVPWKRLAQCTLAGLAGLAIVPALVVSFFLIHHVGSEMYDCVILHNVLPSDPAAKSRSLTHLWLWLKHLPLLIAGVVIISRLQRSHGTRARLAFLFLAANFYLITLNSFWPILTDEDYLPYYPAWMITLGPICVWLADAASRRIRLPAFGLLAALVAVELVAIWRIESPIENCNADKISMIANTLKLTDPKDFVMDSKGETIYRNRPFRYVIEGLTIRRIRRGLINDDIPERLVETRTPVVASLHRMPKRGKTFIAANYIPIAYRVCVLGKFLKQDEASPDAYAFDLAVPNRYTLVCQSGQLTGTLDGTPFNSPRELAAGRHVFRKTSGEGALAIIWAQAVERGFSPFAKIKPDALTPQD